MFVVVMVTVAGALFSTPLFTTSCATYLPGRSATKVGFPMDTLDSAALLFVGLEVSDQDRLRLNP